jgi:DNA-directed RNA polymerase subunit RPC12/RpoP
METETHKWLKKIALEFLREKVSDLIVNECSFKCGISDAVGLNYKRKEVRVVECKAVKSDYLRDKKLFNLNKSYYAESHYFYIMCPENVIMPEDVIPGIGLIWVDEYGKYTLVKKPIKNTKKLRTLFDTTLKLAIKRLSNELYFAEEKQYKDLTNEQFSKRADIYLISAICPKCRHATRELISKENTKEIKCNHCKTNIILEKAKVREISGFNNKFIKRMKELIDK